VFAVAGVQRDVDNAAIGEPNSDPMHTARRQVDFRPVGGVPWGNHHTPIQDEDKS
jgi:hypothetical protein